MMYHFKMPMPAIVTLSFFAAAPAHAQCPATWVPGIGTPGTNGEVNTMAVLPVGAGGDVIVGGSFTFAGGGAASRIARYNPTTGAWSALGSGTNATVYSLLALPTGDVVVGGLFTTAGGVFGRNNIAMYNLNSGAWSGLGAGTNSNVNALAVLSGGDLIVGGNFTTAGGVAANRIARYNPSTGVWSALGTGTNSTVYTIAILPGGDLLVGGVFTAAGGGAANCIARYNLTTGIWSALGSGVLNTPNVAAVNTMAILPGGDVIVGGRFTQAGGIAFRNGVARYNPATGAWSDMASGTNDNINVLNVAVRASGDVVVGGNFLTAGNVTGRNNIALYNPSTGIWTTMGSGTDGAVNTLAVLANGDAIVGGTFASAGGAPASRIARLIPIVGDPSIFSQPLPVVTLASNNAVFFVGAAAGAGSGSNPAYQWRKGGVAINTVVNPSAATPGLSLTNVQAADLGTYDCLVTNACGSTGPVSSAATLSFAVDPCTADFNNDGSVDFFDYLDFVDAFSIGC